MILTFQFTSHARHILHTKNRHLLVATVVKFAYQIVLSLYKSARQCFCCNMLFENWNRICLFWVLLVPKLGTCYMFSLSKVTVKKFKGRNGEICQISASDSSKIFTMNRTFFHLSFSNKNNLFHIKLLKENTKSNVKVHLPNFFLGAVLCGLRQ